MVSKAKHILLINVVDNDVGHRGLVPERPSRHPDLVHRLGRFASRRRPRARRRQELLALSRFGLQQISGKLFFFFLKIFQSLTMWFFVGWRERGSALAPDSQSEAATRHRTSTRMLSKFIPRTKFFSV